MRRVRTYAGHMDKTDPATTYIKVDVHAVTTALAATRPVNHIRSF
jgi:hypothetical protein